jgi:hypothetical protein
VSRLWRSRLVAFPESTLKNESRKVVASAWCVLTDWGCSHATTKTKDLEPGFGAVLAVGVAEFCLEDAGFVSGPPDLHDDYQDKQKQPPPRRR